MVLSADGCRTSPAAVGFAPSAAVAASALCGALFAVAADTLARTLFAPRELPVGVLTALLGVPVFLLLLYRKVNA
ncbi:iron chelate uptake ABC transporter family permease subunit [Serratia marcescens]|uniref:iron chelate uptake ABC transporter family permease subunit n=1 Tax=Serratia marcescens TaxID=615 RepID=UPI001F5B6147|nr:iron chelate uptake ABC transporter family permease subunit [Serratia marcescens]